MTDAHAADASLSGPRPSGRSTGARMDAGAEAEAIAAVVRADPGVADLSGGPVGAVGTYLPGRRVPGVRATAEAVEVHLVARWVPSLPELAQRVRAALAPLAGGRPVTVAIDDLEVAEPLVAELPPAGMPPAERLPAGAASERRPAGAGSEALPAADRPPAQLPPVGGTA